MQLVSALMVTGIDEEGNVSVAEAKRLDEDVTRTAYVCGTCWEIVAEEGDNLLDLVERSR